LVKEVPLNLPAADAGVYVGDIVERVNDVPTFTRLDFRDALADVRVGDMCE
jgi:S1-C subfamily serine protease